MARLFFRLLKVKLLVLLGTLQASIQPYSTAMPYALCFLLRFMPFAQIKIGMNRSRIEAENLGKTGSITRAITSQASYIFAR